ncbi:MAG: glycogen-debranching protein [Ilumatobacteraceae bacterium]|nr:glycogen-debranching protein [Ilumatobacteraceae bacterium]
MSGEAARIEVRVHAPGAQSVTLLVAAEATAPQWRRTPLRRVGDEWVGSVADGDVYGLQAVGEPALGFDPKRLLVDPDATEVWFPPAHSRAAAEASSVDNIDIAPRAVARRWPSPSRPRRSTRPRVVYEAHVRGATMRRDRSDAGTFTALIDELPRIADLGVSVLELLPVHQYDPDEGNYWGYMPLVFGAVHRGYAARPDAAAELAALVTAAHALDIEVWLDVVVNHTTESGRDGPTYTLRGLGEGEYYALHPDGSYVNDAGTGNIIDATSAPARDLVMAGLDRLADLGVDGFRFDLAAVLARSPEFVHSIGDWAQRRGVALVAEPWDLARYLLGRDFPDPRWAQWNGRFRDDMRSFLRGEAGVVAAMMHRVEGSPDLFDTPATSINFLTAHDGFTMYDLVAYDRKHNDANGWDNTDGHDDNRSWNCGWEGDDGVPDRVMSLRRRQLRNAACLLLLSHGTPMFVAGDEFARTQHGNNNAYNQDNEISWIDWNRRTAWGDHERFVRRLIAARTARPIFADGDWWGSRIEWFGTDGPPDVSGAARAVAWHVGDLYVMANMWWEELTFVVQAPGPWWVLIDTADEGGSIPGFVDHHLDHADESVSGRREPIAESVRVDGRSIVVLTSSARG